MRTGLTAIWLLPLDDADAAVLETEAESHPDWADLQNRWGLALLAASRFAEARTRFEHCLTLNPRYTWATVNLASVLALEGEAGRARDLLNRGPEPGIGVRALTEGWIAVREGRPERGEAALRRLHPSLRGRMDVLWLTAAIAELRDPYAGARAWKHVLSEPGLAACLSEVNALRIPSSDAAKLGGLFPGLAQLWLHVGRLQAKRGEFKETERSSRIAHLHFSDRGSFLNHQGWVASLQGNEERAVAFYREALAACPDTPDAAAALSRHAADQGDWKEAARLLRMAIARSPGFADLHRKLGRAEAKLGRYQHARAALERALEVNPLYAKARRDLGDLLFDEKEWGEALRAYDRCVGAGIQSPEIWIRIARCELQLGDTARAEKAFLSAIALDEDHAEAKKGLEDLINQGGGGRKDFDTAHIRLLHGSVETAGHRIRTRPTTDPSQGRPRGNSR